MRKNIRNISAYGDDKVNSLARDTAQALNSVNDATIHKVRIQWNPSLVLTVPFFGGENRLIAPAIVRCERAKNLTDSTVLVTPGGVAWDWVGAGAVRIDAVSGLTVGVLYELTFEVVG